jgi:hypothetical protein
MSVTTSESYDRQASSSMMLVTQNWVSLPRMEGSDRKGETNVFIKHVHP